MSPAVIITDELGTEEEAAAVYYAKGSGAAIIASAHGGSFEEIEQKPHIGSLIRRRVFDVLIPVSYTHLEIPELVSGYGRSAYGGKAFRGRVKSYFNCDGIVERRMADEKF